MSIIIGRPALDEFLSTPGRRLLYGRRKTGKTYYTRHKLREYNYYIVRRGGTIYDPEEDLELEPRAFLKLCMHEDKIILDEFHRAPPRLLDAVQANYCGGDLVFITSTLHYHRRFTEGPEAPLKGLFKTMRVGLLSPLELLAHPWREKLDDIIDVLIFYQEPLLIGWTLGDIARSAYEIAYSLTGEILDEEDYTLTRRYNSILEAIAAGKTRLTEIASHLYARGLLDSPSTSRITKYLEVLVHIGLLERVPLWGAKRRSIYRHASPLTWTAYYMESRYGVSDLPFPERVSAKIIGDLIPLLAERFVERLLSHLYGLAPVRILDPEVDIALVDRRRLAIVGEVKWSRSIDAGTLRRVASKLSRFSGAKRILVVRDKSVLPLNTGGLGLEVYDLEDLRDMAVAALSV